MCMLINKPLCKHKYCAWCGLGIDLIKHLRRRVGFPASKSVHLSYMKLSEIWLTPEDPTLGCWCIVRLMPTWTQKLTLPISIHHYMSSFWWALNAQLITTSAYLIKYYTCHYITHMSSHYYLIFMSSSVKHKTCPYKNNSTHNYVILWFLQKRNCPHFWILKPHCHILLFC